MTTPETKQEAKWTKQPIYWANHPEDPKDKPRQIASYEVRGPGVYLVNLSEDAADNIINAMNGAALFAEMRDALEALSASCKSLLKLHYDQGTATIDGLEATNHADESLKAARAILAKVKEAE